MQIRNALFVPPIAPRAMLLDSVSHAKVQPTSTHLRDASPAQPIVLAARITLDVLVALSQILLQKMRFVNNAPQIAPRAMLLENV